MKSGVAWVNLDHVTYVDPQSDGKARFYFDGLTNWAEVDFGSTLTDAQAGAEKVLQGLDPVALYT
jgi:hypothetical protein